MLRTAAVRASAGSNGYNFINKLVNRGGASASYPMDVAFPGVATTSAESQALPAPEAKLTTLPNGVRVVSQETYGQSSTVGVFVDAGSRYETSENTGVSHLIDRMAFKSTKVNSHFANIREIEKIGANALAASSRESIMYQGDCLREFAPRMLGIIAETIRAPALFDHEIDEQKESLKREYEELRSNPNMLLTEEMHVLAFDRKNLGNPLYASPAQLNKLDKNSVSSFMDSNFTPGRLVVSGAGVNHEELVSVAKELFGDLTGSAQAGNPSKSEYSGGDLRLKADSDKLHLTVAFNAPGWRDSADLIPTCVLQMLLGGGGSFSAGGPGKGMYSRLYTQALNRYHWMDSCTAFSSIYNDSGLFGIYGTTLEASKGEDLAKVIVQQLQLTAEKPTDEDLRRAKNMLKSSLFMNLESRAVLFEDLGRQVLTYGRRTQPHELAKQIDSVKAEDLQRVAKKMLSSSPTVVAFGDHARVPRYDLIAKSFK